MRVSMRAFVCDDLLSKFIAFKPLLVWVADNQQIQIPNEGHSLETSKSCLSPR